MYGFIAYCFKFWFMWMVLNQSLSFDLCEWCWIKALITSFIYLIAIYLPWLELLPIALIYLSYFICYDEYNKDPKFLDPHHIKMIGPEVPSYKKIGHEVPVWVP